MGVHGLTSWVGKHSTLGTTLSLPDSRETAPIPFILDGLAFLYQVGLVDPVRGGGYAVVRANTRTYVEYWRACGLAPEVVWDGTPALLQLELSQLTRVPTGPFGASKIPTIIQRASQSLTKAVAYMRAPESARGGRMGQNAARMPPLALSACVSELEALGVPMHFAEEEADSPTAELAQRRMGLMASNGALLLLAGTECS